MKHPVPMPVAKFMCAAAGVVATGLLAGVTMAALFSNGAAEALTRSAVEWIGALDAEQKALAVRPFEAATRTEWHFVPKPSRKGVQLRDMTDAQQAAALRLLAAAVSQVGYRKSTEIMQLDELLRILEGSKAKNIRDARRYFFTVFGTPVSAGRWGLSIEGHHLSLNFTMQDGKLVDSTPQFMGANPAEVKATFAGLPPAGHRVLADEETLAFELVNSLAADQRDKAVIAAEAPKEIRAAGDPQPPQEPAAGIGFAELTADQQQLLLEIVEAYCESMREEVVEERMRLIDDEGWAAVRFAWAGSLSPGVGHAYRIEGPTFVIEFVNVQPDAEGNPANHIHCVWRDRTGDFDLPVR